MACRYITPAEKLYTPTLDALIIALCRDFESRGRLMQSGEISSRTGMEYQYLNYKIFDATAEIASCGRAVKFIDEIGRKVGYAKIETDGLSEEMYKARKREIKLNIARKLHLLD